MIYWISALHATSSTHPALYAVSVRAVGISPRTSFPTVRCLPAAVLQVSDSVSSRFLRDFHPSSHIASVVPKEQPICVLRGWAAWVRAAIYFRGTCCPTIIDVPMFHFRVRDGTGWGHWAVTTRLQSVACAVGAWTACLGVCGGGTCGRVVCGVQTDIRERFGGGFKVGCFAWFQSFKHRGVDLSFVKKL